MLTITKIKKFSKFKFSFSINKKIKSENERIQNMRYNMEYESNLKNSNK